MKDGAIIHPHQTVNICTQPLILICKVMKVAVLFALIIIITKRYNQLSIILYAYELVASYVGR